MTGGCASLPLANSTLAQLCAGWIAVLPIAGLALYGWYYGAFLATIAGAQVLAAFLAAVAMAHPVSGFVESLGCPDSQSLALGYMIVFGVIIVGSRLAVGATVPEGAVRFAPLFDQGIGVVMGVIAGTILGGSLLIVWSMADMPAWIRIDNTHQPMDSGGRLLWTFARFVEANSAASRQLLDGDRPAQAASEPAIIRASEPFSDKNDNGRWDSEKTGTADGEAYLDVDGDGEFTPVMAWTDRDGDGQRMVGIRDCYRLAEWRQVRSQHAPRITSLDAIAIVEEGPVEEVVYLATATDVDPGEQITFSVSLLDEDDDLDVTIDPTSGVVTLLEPADFETGKRKFGFVVQAKDKSGLTDQKAVTVEVKDKPE